MGAMLALILIIAVPAFFTLFLASNGAMVYLALCEGLIVNETLGNDAIQLLRSTFPSTNAIQESTLHLIILMLPAVLTMIFLRRQMGGAKAVFNIAPAILTGATIALLAVPLLPGGVRHNIEQTWLWQGLDQFGSVIIGVGALTSLLLIWTGHSKRKHHRRKR